MEQMEVLKKLHVGQSGLFKPSLYVLLSSHKSNNSTIKMIFKYAGRFKHCQFADGQIIQCLKKLCIGQSADGYLFCEFTHGSGQSADGSDLQKV